MNKNHEALASLLAAAIKGSKPEIFNSTDIDFNIVFNEAVAHQVHALLYPVIKMLSCEQEFDNALLLKWQKVALLSGIIQAENIDNMKHILTAFSNANIKVITLKGLVLRNLYPHPELRTMSDADILVHLDDIERAKKILVDMEFEEQDVTYKHIHFIHKSYPSVELHWSLITDKLGSLAANFENVIWENSIPSSVCGAPALIPCVQDHLLYMLLHMAGHFINSGFGLRQLSDVVLFTESYYDEIDWNSLKKRLSDYGIENFVNLVFLSCHELFNLKLPSIFQHNTQTDSEFIRLFIDDIFAGGVYGGKTAARGIGNALVTNLKHENKSDLNSKVKYWLFLLFPHTNDLNDKYSYAKKYPFLTPAAWIHRLAHGALRKDFSMCEKSSMLISSPAISQQRAKLLHWLDL